MRVDISPYKENKKGIAVFIPDKSYNYFGTNRGRFENSITSQIKNLPNGVKLEPNDDFLGASNYGNVMFSFNIKSGSYETAAKELEIALLNILPSGTTINIDNWYGVSA